MDPKDSIKLKYFWFILFLLVVSIFFYFYLQQENKSFFKNNLVSYRQSPKILVQVPNIKVVSSTTVPEPVADQGLNFLFFGDIMLDRNVATKITKNGLESLFDPLLDLEPDFFTGFDLVSANLEGAVTNKGQHYAPVATNDFAFSPEVVQGLKKYNFNFFNIANNHLTDQGLKGAQETSDNLKALGFNFSGCSDAQVGECSGQIVEINNLKVAMLGFSMVYKPLDLKAVQKIITDYKAKSDLVLVNIHWGVEYEHQYNTTQSNLAHAMIDSGADVIIGHHPHVVQGLEFYNNKPIFYSLGNFIFDQYFSAATQQGLAVGLNINPKTKQVTIDLLPLQESASQVTLMAAEAKLKFLENLSSWSKLNEELSKQLLTAQIIL